MCEVVRSNFEEKFSEIERSLTEATFIAVDTEFSGGISNAVQCSKPSLFDSASDRYSKLLQNVNGCIIVQMGLTAFRSYRDENKYVATTYNFYIFPKPFASVDVKFMVQSSSLDYLCRYGFDFNKFVYEGVSYLSRSQAEQLQAELDSGSLLQQVERSLLMDGEYMVQRECSRVSEWQGSAVVGDHLLLGGAELLCGDTYLPYMLHRELRSRFAGVWTFVDVGRIRVVKVSEDERRSLEEQEHREHILDQQFLQYALGFSKVFALLTNLKKPIVGHNLFMDLLFMYNQFHEPLPAQYSKFKQKISELFPAVFDTKYMSFELAKGLRREDKWVPNILEEMYTYFKEAHGREIVMYSPLVESTNGDLQKKFHEAGWDSYCTGFCFIKMAHILASMNGQGLPRALTSTEHLAAVNRMKGCVNIIRAKVSHVCLLGDDPQSKRPGLLHVSAKGLKVINSSELAALFAAFGAVDVKLCSRRRALVAVGTHRIARDALNSFKGHKELDVSLYSPLRHSSLVRGLLWSGLVTSVASFTWLVMRTLSKK